MNVFYKKKLYTAIVLLVGLTVAVTILTSKPKPVPQSVPAPVPPMVAVISAATESQRLSVLTQGTVQPRREIDLVAQVGGKVEWVAPAFAAGGFFDQGQPLLHIEDADYRFALSRARSSVAQAEQTLATERGRARQAKREWRDLGNRDANDLFLRKPQLAAAEAALAAAIADREQAQLNLQRTKVVAPFNGRIRQTPVDLGQYVAPGTPVARFYATDVVEVRLPLTDKQVALLNLPLGYHNGSPEENPEVKLTAVFAGQAWQWSGRITRTDASIDVESRVVYAVAEVEKPFDSEPGSQRPPLNIGQFVEAEIGGSRLDNVLLLPRSALQPGDSIWVVDEEERLQALPVKVLQANSQRVAIQFDQPQRLRVVSRPIPIAVAGMPVTAVADGVR